MRAGYPILFCIGLLLVGLGQNYCCAEETKTQMSRPSQLRCEYLVDPLGIGERAPRLSWIMESSRRGDRQIAYQVLVSSTKDLLTKNRADIWDSSKVASDESAHVVYRGKPLLARMSCFWKVRVWSGLDERPSPWSDDAHWTMGLLNEQDWSAKWIDSHAAIRAGMNLNPVKILSAIYAPVPSATTTRSAATTQANNFKDVTAQLSGLFQDGVLTVTANNASMGGDPQPDVRKELTIEYERGGKKVC